MHMANELLSVPVAAGTWTLAAAGLAIICRRAKKIITSDSFALMGIMGAFVFAAQMVNFRIPFMPGTSGHMVGAVLLAILLGPYAAAIVMTSVVIIQCLIFQDGGILALGCNIINMAIVPSFVGYAIYSSLVRTKTTSLRVYLAAIVASTVSLVLSACLVPVQAASSGVLTVPVTTFLVTMIIVHIPIGLIEGFITAAVLLYIRRVRPQIIESSNEFFADTGRTPLYASLIILTIIVGAGLSLIASEKPDGLEYSYAERPDQPDFESTVSNESAAVATVENMQSRLAVLPDYTIRADSPARAWTSFAAVLGSAVTMGLVWFLTAALGKTKVIKNAPPRN